MKIRIPILIIMLFIAGKLYGQEVQVPFDSSGKIEVITEEMENHLHLFDKYPHFHEARLFKQNDEAYILEVSSMDDGKLSRNREPKTKSDVLALQKQFTDVATERSPSIFLDQSSRSKFLIWEAILSFGVYGPLVTASLNPSNAQVGIGIYLVVGGLSFIIPYALTKNAPMTDGESSLALGGAFLGIGHGELLDFLFTNGNPGTEMGAIATLTSITETGIGYAIARRNNFSEGTSDVIRYGGLFGGWQGEGIAGLIVLDNSSPSFSVISGLGLLGSAGGYYAGSLLANNQSYSRGNASVLLTAGIYGTIIPVALYSSAFANANYSTGIMRGLILSGMIGNASGIYLAHTLMRGKDFSTGEGNDVILGTTAGFAIGLGVAYIITSGPGVDRASAWSFSIPIVIGTAAGFGIMLNVIGKGSGDEKSSGWNMNFNPGGLMGALLPQKHTSISTYTAPIAGLQYKW